MSSRFIASMVGMSLLVSPLATIAAAPSPELSHELTELREYVERLIDAQSDVPLTNDELRDSIEKGAAWLERAQEGSGHFKYEYHPYTDSYSADDNIVRQAGALYALGEIIGRNSASLEVKRTAEEAIDYFKSISVRTEISGTQIRCIEDPQHDDRCPLGATALALTGLIRLAENDPVLASEYEGLIEDYRTFIQAQQKQNGGFQNLYRVGQKNQPLTESAFSNGEALLALVRAYRYDPDPEVKESITKAVAYLVTQPYDTALYLWIMAALKDAPSIDPSLAHISYIRDFSLWRMERGRSLRRTTQNSCAYSEGLVSALSSLQGNIEDRTYDYMRNEAERGLRANRAYQLTLADRDRAFIEDGKVSILSLERPRNAIGGFLTGETDRTERIDYTQHCVNAYLQMLTDVRKGTL